MGIHEASKRYGAGWGTGRTVLACVFLIVVIGVLIPGCGTTGLNTLFGGSPFSSGSPSCGCQTSQTTGGATVKDLGATEAYQMAQIRASDPSFVILDVRTPDEFATGHIAGAVNLDYRDPAFQDQANQLDRTKAYLVTCGSGSRSTQAAAALIGMGFPEVYNLLGGLAAWKTQGYPVTQ